MSKKKHKGREGIVYSTDPEFEYSTGQDQEEETLPPQQQELKVRIDRLKGNKEATVITGFTGTNDDLKALGKELRQKCGVGGSDKGGDIIVQGNVRDKVLDYLKSKGYKAKPQGG